MKSETRNVKVGDKVVIKSAARHGLQGQSGEVVELLAGGAAMWVRIGTKEFQLGALQVCVFNDDGN